MIEPKVENPAKDSLGEHLEAILRQEALASGIDYEIAYQLQRNRMLALLPQKPPSPQIMTVITPEEEPQKPIANPIKKIKLDSSYNLRRRKARKPLAINDLVINQFSDAESYKDRILKKVNIDSYHMYTPMTEPAQKILSLSRRIMRSQIDCFSHEKSNLLVRTWLTTVRIFEYNPKINSYREVKRIPKRYIEMAPNLILSIHHTDEALLVGYLVDNDDKHEDSKHKTSYLEFRNLFGKQVHKSYYYDQVVKSIASGGDFVYVLTVDNFVYIHHRANFSFRVFQVDMKLLIRDKIINVSAKPLGNSSLQLTAITTKSLIVSQYDALCHTVLQNFNLDTTDGPAYVTVSSFFLRNDLVIILRRLMDSSLDDGKNSRSKLILGRILKCASEQKKNPAEYFVLEATIGFSYHIRQVEHDSGSKVYIFGSPEMNDETPRYELGCIDLEDFKPIWAMPLNEIDPESQMLVHNDHVVIVCSTRDEFCIRLDDCYKSSECQMCHIKLPGQSVVKHELHSGILRDIKILRNRSLLEME